jgi:catechol 2,3-dioxygenase-like lactoylglutathione lyase family enzyme
MRALGFDHCLMYGPNVAEVLRFFTEALDFSLVEKVQTPDGPIAVWLTSSTKSHEIAFVEHAEPGKFHHVSFLLESWNDVGHAATVQREDVCGRKAVSSISKHPAKSRRGERPVRCSNRFGPGPECGRAGTAT